jgi:hypothetical protein
VRIRFAFDLSPVGAVFPLPVRRPGPQDGRITFRQDTPDLLDESGDLCAAVRGVLPIRLGRFEGFGLLGLPQRVPELRPPADLSLRFCGRCRCGPVLRA